MESEPAMRFVVVRAMISSKVSLEGSFSETSRRRARMSRWGFVVEEGDLRLLIILMANWWVLACRVLLGIGWVIWRDGKTNILNLITALQRQHMRQYRIPQQKSMQPRHLSHN